MGCDVGIATVMLGQTRGWEMTKDPLWDHGDIILLHSPGPLKMVGWASGGI